jgi:hypothetical protein
MLIVSEPAADPRQGGSVRCEPDPASPSMVGGYDCVVGRWLWH